MAIVQEHPVTTRARGSKVAITGLPLLSRRQLNRALIARQFLNRRHDLPVEVVLEHLAGMQSQVPADPFLGLRSRLDAFQPAELDTLMLERRAVRIGVMRGTIHVVTARDALHLRVLTQAVYERIATAQPAWREALDGIDMPLFLATRREVFGPTPGTGRAARVRFREAFPDRDPEILALVVRHMLPLVQITPRGTWGASHAPAYQLADRWLDHPLPANASIDEYILRYLRAFGPATVADIQSWSRINTLRPHVDRLRPQLRTFRNERGQELFDVLDGLLPDGDTELPVRFLPEYDNILLSHKDRTRILSEEFRASISSNNGRFLRTYLLDGFVHGWWGLQRGKDATILAIEPFTPLSRIEQAAIEDEAARLLTFLTPGAPHATIRFEEEIHTNDGCGHVPLPFGSPSR